jgi:3-deoxy-7-phosphoheptulonate synthase
MNSRKILTGKKIEVKINKMLINKENPLIIAGPCSVESREQIIAIAKEVKKYGANALRGGAFKPRTSPYAFQGLEEEGLKYLKEASEITGLPIVSEITDQKYIEMFNKYVDVFQVGSRNMDNYSLLKALGRVKKPILLKRGMSATIYEWILAAEYLAEFGNTNIILCERGIRTFGTYTRNILDLSAIPIMKKETGLPVIVDPSHGTGRRELIKPMTLAAFAAGADGAIIEVHDDPDNALSDGHQSIRPEQFKDLMNVYKRTLI